jgi:rhamnogalacturonyl hydrolase YesR
MINRWTFAIVVLCGLTGTALAQSPQPATPLSTQAVIAAAGDAQPDSNPIASLSPAMTRADITKALKLVADWQVKTAAGKFNQDWTYAPLYLGLIAASSPTADSRYNNLVLKEAETFRWSLLAVRNLNANDEGIAQAYELLYGEDRAPVRIANARATFDRLAAYHDTSARELWWWCDTLFMAPAGLARMSALTGNRKYLVAMDREWRLTQTHLYDPAQRLFFRDASFIGKHEPNGQDIFWTRGNGWVLAGLANVLAVMPKNDPLYTKYEHLFQDMAARVVQLRQPDGLWHSSLLDPQHYPLPEVSGSAFFTYGIVWGIDHGLLDQKTFGPVVEKAWAGMLKHVYADGRLGCIQPVGDAPATYPATSSYVYGVGAFLMAGSELEHYAKQ